MRYEDLTDETRQIMLDEIESDIENDELYMSQDFNESGQREYPDLLKTAVENGTASSLAEALRQNNCFKRRKRTKQGIKKVAKNAPERLAEGEFGKYYVKALARRAQEENSDLEAYRAKPVDNPRHKSEKIRGTKLPPQELYREMDKPYWERNLSIPVGPNSGILVRLV